MLLLSSQKNYMLLLYSIKYGSTNTVEIPNEISIKLSNP
jgi:hypothetical protein